MKRMKITIVQRWTERAMSQAISRQGLRRLKSKVNEMIMNRPMILEYGNNGQIILDTEVTMQ